MVSPLRRLWRTLLRFLYALTIGWMSDLLALAIRLGDRAAAQRALREAGEEFTDCQVIPPDVYKRPDPLIYSQLELMNKGLAVTWDNPDIQLFDVAAGMVPVPSHALRPGTEYEIRATVYNGSTEAPAVGLTVDFSYLSFGIGTVRTQIGQTIVDLPVRGGAGHPAIAAVRWQTPAEGHYCIQANLIWPDDANPGNNLGQENTNVGAAHSPATFEFPVHNANVVDQALTLAADMYEIPGLSPCPPEILEAEPRRRTREDWCREALGRSDSERFGIEEGWAVEIEPRRLQLRPGETREVTVTVEPPPGFAGARPVNVNATDGHGRPIGGVSLHVDATGT